MINSSIPIAFDKIGFAASFITNFFVVYLTVFHIKKMSRTYKKMVIMFAVCGILYTSIEVITRPFSHNYNKCLAFFSLNFYLSRNIVQFLLAAWAGVYVAILSLITVQFLYRFLCLLHIQKAKQFDNITSVIWMIYPFLPGGFYTLSFYLFCIPDEYSDDYMKIDLKIICGSTDLIQKSIL
uniref:Serpentine receptor class gamma n=1 Tax=Caenorhabditis tropicalis TaxID=1561998 RepID=A0A1I7T6R0_9PELO